MKYGVLVTVGLALATAFAEPGSTGNTNWTVDLSDPSVPHTASVVREGDKIFVSVEVLGMTVIFR